VHYAAGMRRTALLALAFLVLGCPSAGDPPAPALVCGDGSVDDGEVCDDGNLWGGDGCTHLCTAETGPSETEPNGLDTPQALPDGGTVDGAIQRGDEDCFTVEVADGHAVRATLEEPDGCSGDAIVEVLDADGVRVVSGPPAFDTGCSTIEPDTSNDARYLGAGTHTVCVAPILDTVVPSYTLSVELVDSCADLPSLAPDPSQDLDGDGIADVCDPDDDDDGVDDVVDNCPDAPNGADSPFPWSTASDGFVTLWMVLGAFTEGVTPGDCEPSPDAFAATSDADAEPVLGDVASDRSWFAWFAWPGDTAILRFTDWFNDAAPREAYVMSWVYSPQQRAASLAVGSDDGQVVWLNGVEVGRKLNCSGVSADQLQFAVTLEAGWNRLLHKVYDGGGGWGVVARFYEEDQVTPMTDLGLSLLGPTDHVDDQTDTDGDGIGDFCDPEP